MLTLLRSGWHDLTHRPASQQPALDALRAAAVLLVICTHYARPEWPAAGGPELGLLRWPVFYFGWTGVDLFFVLSGYFIGGQLWRELQRSETIDVPRFLMKRGLRIWPLYFVVLALLGLSGAVHIRWTDWIFVSNYTGTDYSRSWSLAVEEQFYLAVPAILLLSARTVSLTRQGWLIAALVPMIPVLRAVTRARLLASGLPASAVHEMMLYPIHLHCEALLIGLWLAWAQVIHPDWFRRSPLRGRAVLVAGCALGLALDVANKELFAFTALGLIFGALAYWAITDDSWATRPLAAFVWYPISRLSYGMYLNHFLVVPESTAWAVRHFPTPVAFAGGLLIGTAISIGAATVTFLAVEHPFLALRTRLLAPKRVVLPAGAGYGAAHETETLSM